MISHAPSRNIFPSATNLQIVVAFAGLYLLPALAAGHCVPIGVTVVGNQLTLQNAVPDAVGFASQMFVNDSSDCMLEVAPVDRYVTDIPGFDISGMAINSGLYLSPVVRTASALTDVGTRYLWYWNPDEDHVALAPDDIPLRVRSQQGLGTMLLPRDDTPPPEAMRIAAPGVIDLNEHRHLLRYDFTGLPIESRGVYGFYAELTSPAYHATDPFLVVFGLNVSAQEVNDGALAINFAAGAGDFSGDTLLSCEDLEQIAREIHAGRNSPRFDINGDDHVDGFDVVTWLAKAGAFNLPDHRSYSFGDANLDGFVDGVDFNLWHLNRGKLDATWCDGDFTIDGRVDEADFAVWNANRFSPANTAAVPTPEPGSQFLMILAIAVLRTATCLYAEGVTERSAE